MLYRQQSSPPTPSKNNLKRIVIHKVETNGTFRGREYTVPAENGGDGRTTDAQRLDEFERKLNEYFDHATRNTDTGGVGQLSDNQVPGNYHLQFTIPVQIASVCIGLAAARART